MSPDRKGSQLFKNRRENIQVTDFMASITFFLNEKSRISQNKTTTHLSILPRRKETWPLPAFYLTCCIDIVIFFRKCHTELCILKRKLQCLWTKNGNNDKELNLDFSFLSLLPRSSDDLLWFQGVKDHLYSDDSRMDVCSVNPTPLGPTVCPASPLDVHPRYISRLEFLDFPSDPSPSTVFPQQQTGFSLQWARLGTLQRSLTLQSPYPEC